MEKERKTKTRKRIILQILMWTCFLFSVGTCTRYILWVSLHRAKPNNQPKYSAKEECYFKELEKKDNWRIQRANALRHKVIKSFRKNTQKEYKNLIFLLVED